MDYHKTNAMFVQPARQLIAMAKYDRCEELLRQGLKETNNDGHILFLYGELLEKMDRTEEAAEKFELAAGQYPVQKYKNMAINRASRLRQLSKTAAPNNLKHDGIMQKLIDATAQELERLEHERNRPRYYIFGKIYERWTADHYVVAFKYFHDAVQKQCTRREVSLFLIRQRFIKGHARIDKNQQLTISFAIQDLAAQGLSQETFQNEPLTGLECVLDTRELIRWLRNFLEQQPLQPNPFLSSLFSRDEKTTDLSPGQSEYTDDDLNESQLAAIQTALSNKVTIIWGPPGTGKTKTLGKLAALLISKSYRVLVTAQSNVAVDQVFLEAAKNLSNSNPECGLARLGSNMTKQCLPFGNKYFKEGNFGAPTRTSNWSAHVKEAQLLAANFTWLTMPKTKLDPVDFVIADEVSIANIPSIAAISCFANCGFVLAGDPRQLPPVYPEDSEQPNEYFSSHIFTHIGICEPDNKQAVFLDTQYRMQPEIGTLVSDLFYNSKLKTATEAIPCQSWGGSRVIFIQMQGEVTGSAEFTVNEQRRFNSHHADAVVNAVLRSIKEGTAPRDVGVIAPYNAQINLIRSKLFATLTAVGFDTDDVDDVEVGTVHSYQGKEKRVIVLDITDDMTVPTLLTAKPELINVALSRAKEYLIIIGNENYLLNPDHFSDVQIAMFDKLLSRSTKLVCNDAVTVGVMPATTKKERTKQPVSKPIVSKPLTIMGKKFAHVCNISPQTISREKIALPIKTLHMHGKGPFCQFSIPENWGRKEGVYVLTVDNRPHYVGETTDLERRWNRGYGQINDANRAPGGTVTDCRINSSIRQAFSDGAKIDLYFKECKDRIAFARALIAYIDPAWNLDQGKYPGRTRKKEPVTHASISISQSENESSNAGNTRGTSKYELLGLHLAQQTTNQIQLSFAEMEQIIGASLPDSASKYPAWWSNGGHSQSDAWLKHGWRVSSVKLGQHIGFSRI